MTASVQLRPVYTAEQFAKEVYGGTRSRRWVSDRCRSRQIKTVARKPWVIPQSEALRVISPTK